ncbi:MAG: hypothetical protein FD166_952 [Bacteroidetes bacterium]|nr:MAG: hypothetical protein FD166_952 [Bacteroidota bacterium]
MKTSLIVLFPVMLLLAPWHSHGQENCRVLKTGISGSYTGDCKKGLAHGQGIAAGTDSYEGQFRKGLPDGTGTYNWSTGEVYTGQWKEGKRNGIGKFIYTVDEKDTILDGQWINDKFAGPVVPKPLIKAKEGIDRYTFRKNGTSKNRVMINIYQNGARNGGISDLMISSSSGYESTLGPATGFEEITFPVNIKVMYTTPNKLNTTLVYVKFEFEISEPGDWTVDLHN